MKFLAFLEGSLFFLLSMLHFYWALGGKWGFLASLPTTKQGKTVLNPKKIDSTLVGLFLLAFTVFYFNLIFTFFHLPSQSNKYIGWSIALLFLIRAVGDFKYIGFFKKIKETAFAKMDQNYFSPLCLTIAIIALLLPLLN
ncbi:MAG: DUF3995 domain-containing protein [Flavobacteriaceae bacterium]